MLCNILDHELEKLVNIRVDILRAESENGQRVTLLSPVRRISLMGLIRRVVIAYDLVNEATHKVGYDLLKSY